MKSQGRILKFIAKEWLLVAAATSFSLTALYAQRLPIFSWAELQILVLLMALFIAVKGLDNCGVLLWIARTLDQGRFVALKMVTLTFVLSMVITNDATLVVMVPLTLTLEIRRKDILIILEALAANAGSAMTPMGNPQNLFLFWFYQLTPNQFVTTIAPLAGVFLILLAITSLFVNSNNISPIPQNIKRPSAGAPATILMLVIVLLAVLHVLPFWASLVTLGYGLAWDRKALRIDFMLLISLAFLFGFADNMKIILGPSLEHPDHVFWLSALASQIMSNVPATLLFAKFTPHWPALLWGVSVGGFGSLLGSVANLIAYKIYLSHAGLKHSLQFTTLFMVMGYTAFVIGVGLYYLFGI